MNEDISRKRLGRGLAALIGEMDAPDAGGGEAPSGDGRLPINAIRPNPGNPRGVFAESDIEDLARSIGEHGVVQPVVVRPARREPGVYEIIAGERRWRAAQKAGLSELPVIVRDVDDRTALEIAIVENVQRTDLNPIEEARGYEQLMNNHGYTQLDLAKVIGKSRSHVANTRRLLKLPEAVRDMLVDGSLSAGHARTLITVNEPEALARRIVAGGLSVRQAEALAQRMNEGPAKPGAPPQKDADTLALEKRISDQIGLKTTIKQRGSSGELRIVYKSLDQLDELCQRLVH